MSLPIKSGRETTEHARASRAELLGVVIAGIGVALVLKGHDVAGLGLAAIGVFLVGWIASSYARARGDVKSAAVRPPHRTAPASI